MGVIGANYEARPNVTVDVASQLIKSRNAGVLRTGAAALRSADALHADVIGPGAGRGGHRPRRDRPRALGRPRGRARAGVAARPGAPGDPARQRRDHRGPRARGGRARRAHAGPRGGRRGALRRRAPPTARGRSSWSSAASTASACATGSTCCWWPQPLWDELAVALVARLEAPGPAGLPAAPRSPARATSGRSTTATRPRSPWRRSPAPRPPPGSPTLETSGLAATIVTEDPAAAEAFLRRVRRHRRVLERHHPPARRLRAAGRPRDRHQRGPRARPARAGDLPRPLPAPVRRGSRCRVRSSAGGGVAAIVPRLARTATNLLMADAPHTHRAPTPLDGRAPARRGTRLRPVMVLFAP